jgi:hypothetical protein
MASQSFGSKLRGELAKRELEENEEVDIQDAEAEKEIEIMVCSHLSLRLQQSIHTVELSWLTFCALDHKRAYPINIASINQSVSPSSYSAMSRAQ